MRICISFSMLAVLLFCRHAVHAQPCDVPEYEGAITLGGTEGMSPTGVEYDAEGNLFIAGYFDGTVDFDPGEGIDERTATGNHSNPFLTRFNADGSYAWTAVFYNTDQAYAFDVAVDEGGRVAIVGVFYETTDFDPWEGIDERTSAGSTDIFVTVLDTSGAYLWTRTVGGTEGEGPYDAAFNAEGDLFVVGLFRGLLDFDPGPGVDEYSSLGDYDFFILKLTAAGDYAWTATVGGEAPDFVDDVTVDSVGNVVIGGWWGQSVDNTPADYMVDFDPTEGVDWHVGRGAADAYVLKLTGDGDFLWARTFGGKAWETGYGVAVDESDDVYFTGSFNGAPYDDPTVDFDPTSGFDFHTSVGSGDAFLVRLTSDGSYGWTHTFGGTEFDYGMNVAAHASGLVVMIGGFGDFNDGAGGYETDFDPTEGEDIWTTVGSRDIFVSAFTTDDSYVWARAFGSESWDQPETIALSRQGRVATGGWFQGDVDFDPSGDGDIHSTHGATDLFVVQYDCPAVAPACEGDANGDGVVDPLDSGHVLSRFGCALGGGDAACDVSDQNGDGMVDPLDVGYVLARFGECD